jgi:hypothetical protein
MMEEDKCHQVREKEVEQIEVEVGDGLYPEESLDVIQVR